MRISKKKFHNKNVENHTSTCKKYPSCNQVPCGESMNGCEPSYCSKGSKNWALCNMAKWNTQYKQFCVSNTHCKMSRKKRKSKDQVLATELHQKMPYIWRHLGNKTRRKMVKLARKPVKELNISTMR